MERIQLKTQSRTVLGKQVKQLRAEGWVPAVLYGPDTPSRPIQVEGRSLLKAMQVVGSTMLLDLYVDNKKKPIAVLAREIQIDALTGRPQHVDFFQVRLTQKVRTSPRLELLGESPLVKSGGAVMVQILDQLEVECLPTDLIASIPVDLSVLERLDDSIVVGDLPVPPGVTILADPHDIVISVVPPRMARLEEEEELPEGLFVREAEAEIEEEGLADD
jgi:large subunit ribosomal protein L25